MERAEKMRAVRAEADADSYTGLPPPQKDYLDFAGDNYQRIIPQEAVKNWIEARIDASGAISLGLNAGEIGSSLQDLREYLAVLAQDAKFEVSDGKVAKFRTSQDGQLLDVAATTRALESARLGRGEDRAQAIVRLVNARIATKDVNTLGIRELIGVGESNFAGSPVNRRHNIQIGIEAVNGLGVRAKALGLLGENNRGFITILKPSLQPNEKALVEAENRSRKFIYNTVVAQNHLGPEGLVKVEKEFAKTRHERARKGDLIQKPSGKWVRK
jgi:uncharacterized protein YdbL (DUF1318 family)